MSSPMMITAPRIVPIVPDWVAKFAIPVSPEPVALYATEFVVWEVCTDARTCPPIDTATTKTTLASIQGSP